VPLLRELNRYSAVAPAPAAMRAALAFLRAPVFLCRAPFWTALSIFEVSSRCSFWIESESPDSTAVSRRRLHGAGQQSVLGALALAAKYPLFL
jgi:hypothetical protein